MLFQNSSLDNHFLMLIPSKSASHLQKYKKTLGKAAKIKSKKPKTIDN